MSAIDGINQYFIPNTLDGLNPITTEVNASALLIDGTNSMLADIDAGGHRVKNLQAGLASDEAVNVGQLAGYALDSTVVHLAGTETITGNKTFAGTLSAGQVYATGSSFSTYISGVARLSVAATGTSALLGAGNSIYSAIQGTAGTQSLGLYPALQAGAYNPGTQVGDAGIFSVNGASNTTNLIVAPHSSAASGFRMTPTTTTSFSTLSMNNKKITSLANGTASSDAATYGQLTTTVGNYLPLAGGTMSGPINMGSQQITSLSNGTLPSDAATYGQLTTTVGNYLPLVGGTMSGPINMGSQQITSLANGSLPSDAATYGQLTSTVGNYLPLAGGTMSGPINMGSQQITSLANGTLATDAATYGQVTAVDANCVHLTGNETVAGIKTFTSSPVVPGQPTTLTQASSHKMNLGPRGCSWVPPIVTIEAPDFANPDNYYQIMTQRLIALSPYDIGTVPLADQSIGGSSTIDEVQVSIGFLHAGLHLTGFVVHLSNYWYTTGFPPTLKQQRPVIRCGIWDESSGALLASTSLTECRLNSSFYTPGRVFGNFFIPMLWTVPTSKRYVYGVWWQQNLEHSTNAAMTRVTQVTNADILQSSLGTTITSRQQASGKVQGISTFPNPLVGPFTPHTGLWSHFLIGDYDFQGIW